jgi:hypothetical protein
MIIPHVYFVQNETIAPNQKKWVKIGWKKTKHILSFEKLFHVVLHMLM